MNGTVLRAVTIVGARVLGASGAFTRRTVAIEAGRFTGFRAGSAAAEVLDATEMWVIPGVYDCHAHISWNDFHAADRARRSLHERTRQSIEALVATLHSGVTSMRDAGGADAELRDAVATGRLVGPRMQIAIDMFDASHAGGPDKMAALVASAVDRGAEWIKLIATAGVATPDDAALKSHFSRDEIFTAVEIAARGGARAMVHTWGGDSIDWAIESGAASIEHGIYITRNQVVAAAAAGMTLVPTLTIYRLLRDMVLNAELDGVALDRINDVIAAHQKVIPLAQQAGLALAVGSDFSTPQQHGRNLAEIGALLRAGLTPGEALLAATRNGARLFNDPDGGVIAPGYRADAVILSADPADPTTFERPDSVAAVIQAGKVVHRSTRV